MEINRLTPTPVSQINKLQQAPASSPVGAARQVEKTFSETLNSLSNSAQTSDNLIQQLAAGENVDIHNVMIAAEENDVNFRVAIGIRDRLIDAYREVMRMAV
jgi:flagellar hook-basal body complex protein FliE